MPTENITPIRPDVKVRPAPKPPSAALDRTQIDVRHGSLPSGVSVEAETRTRSDGCFISLTYRGTMDALVAAGCLTPGMKANRQGQRSGRTQRDEHGKCFKLHRSPTKATPDRMKLMMCRGDTTLAMQLPGVRDLFPEGIPEFAQAEPKSSEPSAADTGPSPTAREFKGKLLDGLSHDLNVQGSISGKEWRGLSRVTGPRFRLADADIQRMESIMNRFGEELFAALEQAVVIDTQQPPRPSHMRLVVDNTSPAVRPSA